jgi:hypothetical protein
VPDTPLTDYERDDLRARARELAYAAEVPLRDRYGLAASDAQVDLVVAGVLAHPGDPRSAAEYFGGALLMSEPLAMSPDIPTDEAYELRIAEALQPLVRS